MHIRRVLVTQYKNEEYLAVKRVCYSLQNVFAAPSPCVDEKMRA